MEEVEEVEEFEEVEEVETVGIPNQNLLIHLKKAHPRQQHSPV